jgi:hypothetical protein
VLAYRRYIRLASVLAIAGALVAAAVLSGGAGTALAKPAASAKVKHGLSKRERARIRRELKRQLRRHPGIAFSKAFMKKAALVEFRLPLTVRLRNSDGSGGYQPGDDLLEIDWDDAAFAWPLEGSNGIPAAPQIVPIQGNFTMESVYGNGDMSGSGELGANEVILGGGVDMTSDPFTISDFFGAPCANGPQLATLAGTPVAITSAGARFGVMNPFSQEIRGTLSLRMTFRAQRKPDCDTAAAPTDQVDNSIALPMPVRFSGKMSISPSITADGKMRFGKITIDDAVEPQLTTFAFVRSCTDPAGTCTPGSFPARLKFKKLTAEVLLGDLFP